MFSNHNIVISGIGLVTPLGNQPIEVWRRIQAGESAAAIPAHFDASLFSCPVCAQVKDFDPRQYLPEPKLVRLMSREAQLAVASARLALDDARLTVGKDYAPDEIGLYGATGLAGLPFSEVAPLIKASAGPDGNFDPIGFGICGLKAISPLLSFKILGNMPICFVSICAGLQGPNCVFTPWEGQGAQAIEAGLLAIHRGIARCVLVGGCDVKTHELAFINLEQQGFFCSWQQEHNGIIPSEGAVFLLLEKAEDAAARGIRPYARLSGFCCRTHPNDSPLSDTYIEVLRGCSPSAPDVIISAAERDKTSRQAEAQALAFLKIEPHTVICPKQQAGNLFAAAAAMQVAMGAVTFNQAPGARRILANCFGHGSEQAAFVLEKS